MIVRWDFHDPSDNFQVGIPASDGETYADAHERMVRFANFIRMTNPDDWRKWRVHCYDNNGDLDVVTLENLLTT